jgi:DNA-binding IclR family transcriptional regulator
LEDIYDNSKIIEYIFDPEISEILAELESGGKESSYLASKSGISEEELKNKLSYLLKHDFVRQTNDTGKTIYTANAEKLGQAMEKSSTFDTAVDGLTTVDSYLN